MRAPSSNVRPPTDEVVAAIADYIAAPPAFSAEAYDTARWCLLDSLGVRRCWR
jgi:2-methylcitrate dehydratase